MTVRITVLGGSGAWPTAQDACSGFLIEHEGFRLLVDLGYATLPQLLRYVPAESIDAAVFSHGHPDHCADLNPLLRARALRPDPPKPLAVYAPPGALRQVLALDRPGMLDDAYQLHEFAPESGFGAGPQRIETRSLPHWVPDAGLRITAGDHVVAYTGDTGPSPAIAELARDADLFIAETSYPDLVPDDAAANLSSALQAGRYAQAAGAGRLMLTHLLPGEDRDAAREAAAAGYDGPVVVAGEPDGRVVTLGGYE